MTKWFGRFGLVFALPLLLAICGIVFVGFKYLAYSQSENEQHLAAKADYLAAIAATAPQRRREERPNILVLYYDDMGFGDLGFTGSRAIATPNIDALAASGTVMTQFHSSAAVCSPARAAFLTGRLPPRAGVPVVVFPEGSLLSVATNIVPGHNIRIPAEEITIADVLGADGYNTGMIGKWHIGDNSPSLPGDMGFAHYYGALYSNDMTPFAIYRDTQIAERAPVDQTRLDALYTIEAVRFISEAAQDDAPFFLHFAHNFPHEPLFAPAANIGRSDAGLYGDVIEGLDDGVGEIVAALKQTGQFDNTIIILTSDNGPWFEGSPGQARGRKGQAFEGGFRVPFLISWPAGIAGGREIPAMAMATDLFPTLLDWLALPLPADRAIDGRSLRPLLAGESEQRPGFLYYYTDDRLMAISDGRFKYHDRQPVHYVLTNSRIAMGFDKGPWLFDLPGDPDESYDVSMRYPAVMERLKAELERKQAEDVANLRGWRAPPTEGST